MRFAKNILKSTVPARLQRAARTFLTDFRSLAERLRPFASSCPPTPDLLEVEAGLAAVAEEDLSNPRPEEEQIWARRLGEQKCSLLGLVRDVETEFLAIGEALERLSGQLNEIQQDCVSLAELTLGRRPDAPVPFAFQLLKKAEDLVLANSEQYGHVFATFGKLQERLSELPRQHAQLIRVLLPLNFITTAFQIEAGRHPAKTARAFSTLAKNVKQMLNDFRATLDRQFQELAESDRIARSLLDQVSASIHQHRQNVSATLEASRNHLSALNESFASSGAGANDLSRLNQAVTRHMGSIVMAQQCQDITRQKIEHVAEAMDEMRTHLEEPASSSSASHPQRRHFVFRAGQIQLRQVQSVFDELNRAGETMKSAMHGLRAEASAAGDAMVRVGGSTLDAKVGSQCLASIGRILAITARGVEEIAEILAAFDPLQAMLAACGTEATQLGRDVRCMALNAQIFATHTPNGETFQVLAQQLRFISDEAIRHVRRLETSREQTAEMVSDLRQRLADYQELGQIEQRVLTAESAVSHKGLLDLESAISDLIRRMARQESTFARSVDQVIADVKFPAVIADAGSQSIGFFEDLLEWSGDGPCDLAAASAAVAKVDRLNSNYTMDSERATHSVALEPIAGFAGAPLSPIRAPRFDEPRTSAPASFAHSSAAIGAERSLHQPPPAAASAPPGRGSLLPFESAALQSHSAEGLGENVELF
jgi:hypothetical protein